MITTSGAVVTIFPIVYLLEVSHKRLSAYSEETRGGKVTLKQEKIRSKVRRHGF